MVGVRTRAAGVFEVVKTVFLPWRHTYRFFVEQARRFRKLDNVTFRVDAQVYKHSSNVMDKWILSALQSLITFVRQEMAAYRLSTVVPKLVDFTIALSNWYVRMNKNRLKVLSLRPLPWHPS